MCDDVDRFPPSAGAEGDPVKLAQKRTTRSGIGASWPAARRRRRARRGSRSASPGRTSATTSCRARTARTCSGSNGRTCAGDGKPDLARYLCEKCGALWDDGERAAAVRKGEWRATKPFKGIAGFHIWEAYAPWRALSEIVTDFLAAKPYPDQLKVWTNTSLGEEWEDRAGEGLDAEELSERAGEYEPWTVPEGAVLAACGVDVQHDRLEVGTYAFGPGEEMWTVAHDVIYGSPAKKETWAQLDELLGKKVRRLDGKALPISATCVDASDGATTGFVLDYCNKRGAARDGHQGPIAPGKPPIGRPSKVDIKVDGRLIERGVPLWPVGSDTIKGVLVLRLHEEGFVHFPAGLDTSYYEQVASEKKVTKFRAGVPYSTWVKKPSRATRRSTAWCTRTPRRCARA
jgi:phage terminase large subunit GpA-like protein